MKSFSTRRVAKPARGHSFNRVRANFCGHACYYVAMKTCEECGSKFEQRSGPGPARSICYSDDCRKARKRRWAKSNRAADPEAYRERTRQWARANRDKKSEYRKSWVKQHPGYGKDHKARYRSRKRNNGVFQITQKDLNRILSTPCRCGNPEVELDHIIPIARGGRHSIGNLQPLCRTCNASKKDRLMSEWRICGEEPERQRAG